jgi:hypothetical protein
MTLGSRSDDYSSKDYEYHSRVATSSPLALPVGGSKCGSMHQHARLRLSPPLA